MNINMNENIKFTMKKIPKMLHFFFNLNYFGHIKDSIFLQYYVQRAYGMLLNIIAKFFNWNHPSSISDTVHYHFQGYYGENLVGQPTVQSLVRLHRWQRLITIGAGRIRVKLNSYKKYAEMPFPVCYYLGNYINFRNMVMITACHRFIDISLVTFPFAWLLCIHLLMQ